MPESLKIIPLAGSDTLVIRKEKNSRFFITTSDSIVIGREALVMLINFLVKNEFIHVKTLEGILEEANTE